MGSISKKPPSKMMQVKLSARFCTALSEKRCCFMESLQ